MVLKGREDSAGVGCLIITGVPAAGKSTVSRIVAQRLARAALLHGDSVNRLIVSGRVWALGEPSDEAASQVQLCNRNLCSLAANFADSGFTPVIDTVIPDRDQLDSFVSALSPRPVRLVVLAPSIEVCRYRNTVRPEREQFFFDDYEALSRNMTDAFGGLGWWLDTSAFTAEETAELILENALVRDPLPS